MEECQEPRCSKEATKKWHGRRVCADHYEQYEEQEYDRLDELQNIS